MGSGIIGAGSGIRRVGSRITVSGSGITSHGIGISGFLKDKGSGCPIFVRSGTRDLSRFWNQGSETWVQKSDQGPVSRKPRKLFGPGKPFLIVCILETKKYMGMERCMKGNFVRIKNMSKEQLCKLKV